MKKSSGKLINQDSHFSNTNHLHAQMYIRVGVCWGGGGGDTI